VLLAVTAAVALGASAPPAAAADRPCWKDLFADWAADGMVRSLYAIRCYSEALSHLPDDVRIYSTAEEDIKRARLDAIRARELPRYRSGVLGVRAQRSKSDSGASSRTDSDSRPGSDSRALQDSEPGRSVIGQASASSDVSATTPPLPLVIGAAFAVLLLAAAGVRTLQVRLLARAARRTNRR
jgi:hypothetical protein